jgi:hypothetical protein
MSSAGPLSLQLVGRCRTTRLRVNLERAVVNQSPAPRPTSGWTGRLPHRSKRPCGSLHGRSSGASLIWRRGGERPPPGAAKIRHVSRRPFPRSGNRSRATVGRSYTPGGLRLPAAS